MKEKMKTPLVNKIEKIISPMAESMGYEIVRVLMVGEGSGKPTLQIMAEKPDGTMPVDDCGRLSTAISAILDVENVLDGAYFLELSSPGIDRPLTRLKDFDKYKDNEVRVEMDTPVNGQKKFKGMLKGIQGDNILLTLEEDGGDVSLPFSSLAKAKLLLTDALMGAVAKPKKQLNKKTGSK
jgi:ribosome maturation factor RimP